VAALNKTALHPVHLAMGARLTDFGGYEMPLHYGSQVEEHLATRAGAGLFDVSHMGLIEVTGGEAASFLRFALSNDISRLQGPDAGQYSLLLNEAGGVEDDLILYRIHSDHFLLVVNCANKRKDFELLQERARGFKVHLQARQDFGILALQGPRAADLCGALDGSCWKEVSRLKRFRLAPVHHAYVARTGYTGEDGFEFIYPNGHIELLWSNLIALGARPVGLAARDTLRIEAGYCLWGNEMNAAVSPLEANLGWAVDLADSERRFVGREAFEVARTDRQRQLLGLVLLERGVMRAGCSVFTEAGEGLVTSGTFSPTLERSIALARLPIAVQAGQQAEVELRGKRLPALVCRPAFVANGSILVDI